jgi:uroporphyrinogen-III decarboxylase
MSLAIAENLPPDVRQAFDKRWQRIADCIAGRTPDRMPVSLIGGFWYAKYGGISCRQMMYDYEATNAINERAILEFEPDISGAAGAFASWGPVLDKIDFKQLEWPGHGVAETASYQYLDREYMLAEEYDDFLFDPTGFLFEKYLPRVAGAFDGLQPLGTLAGNSYFGVAASAHIFQQPNVVAAFEQLKSAGEETVRTFASLAAFAQRMTSQGFPLFGSGFAQAPYDVLADFMRGATNMMKDLYRRPDKVLATLDKLGAMILKRTLAGIQPGGSPIVMIPIHWAPDNFMSPKQFDTFFWPSFKKLMLALIDHGLVPMPLWESDCTKRLETIADMPPHSCIYWFEGTDMVKAYEVLGDKIALHGNLSASLMATGTPGEVDAAVRHLAENVFHKGGKLILSTNSGIPEETPIENVRAMFAAARKYGS